MSRSIPVALHPVVVCEDRYSGTYSGALWWAVARADLQMDGLTRMTWLWEHGPGSDDVSAAVFWSRPPPWIATGKTPEMAIDCLLLQERNDTDDWARPMIEDDPRYKRFPYRTGTKRA